jgi:UDP:flavonoid glycosyltransferase YjiC (YdhE family)
MKILLRRHSALGDVLRTLPVSRALSELGHEVTLWTSPPMVDLLDTAPHSSAVESADPRQYDWAVDQGGCYRRIRG